VQTLAQSFRSGGKIYLSLKERLAKDLSMLCLSGAAMRGSTLFQRSNDLLADVADGQLGHRLLPAKGCLHCRQYAPDGAR
jgi:hypothetical protein